MKPQEMSYRIAVDFDGTIVDSEFPTIKGLKSGAKESLWFLRRLGFRIIIWSCRTCHWDYDRYGGSPEQPTLERERVKEMIAFLDTNGVEYDEVDDGSRGKPSADYYIDDKAVRFDNNWAPIVSVIYEREMLNRSIRFYVDPLGMVTDQFFEIAIVKESRC